MSRNDLFTKYHPDQMGAREAFIIPVGVKRDLLTKVFGRCNVEELDREIADPDNNTAYLNAFGANVHWVTTGGNCADPIMHFNISGHHPGEACETLKALYDASNGPVIQCRNTH